MIMQKTQDPQAAFIAAHRALMARISHRAVDTPVPAVDPERRRRSLRTCHRYAVPDRPGRGVTQESRTYVPELSAGIEDDPNLTDGARRCARKLAELTYRRHRGTRALPVTVTYLAKALGRCTRTVQRYLRQLEGEGYIQVEVVASVRSRLCIGLMVRLLAPSLAAHHRQSWPGGRTDPGVTAMSLNQSLQGYHPEDGHRMSVERWAQRCMDGVFRALMKTSPLAGLPALATS